MIPDKKGNIKQIIKNDKSGYIMMGHVYWNLDFSNKMLELINQDQGVGKYDTELWEQILADNIKTLPPMEIKAYPSGVIYEFDSLEDLRQFDSEYISNTNSKIIKDISQVLKCEEKDVHDFRIIKNGLTNTSIYFEALNGQFIYRYPNNTSGSIVNRTHERRSLELAKLIGINPTFLIGNESDGWIISRYVENAHNPDYKNTEDIRRVAAAMRFLHDQELSVSWSFLPWEEIRNMELFLSSY